MFYVNLLSTRKKRILRLTTTDSFSFMSCLQVLPNYVAFSVSSVKPPPVSVLFTYCSRSLFLLQPIAAGSHECVQQEGFDFTQQRICNQWPGAAGSGSEYRLLAVSGGGRHHAFEPEHGHQDVTALRPLEGLLFGWLVTCKRLSCVAKVICCWCNLT